MTNRIHHNIGTETDVGLPRKGDARYAAALAVLEPAYARLRALFDGPVRGRVERSGCRATESFGSLHIRIPLKFCQNPRIFHKHSSENVSRMFGSCSAKIRENIIKLGAKFYENCRK